ncbi:tryptophan halogenase family protein [Planctobacterium marinum]|uniref:Tryptophan halogenase n=1 Tax=Planctobacterium marinum TaxID=1631968 RepID=A0AA48HSF2_9ALTE|nr:tryptophan halogenase [Planctobacterium marinum]
MNKQDIRQVVVVGGGAAGWLTAGRIAAHHHSKQAGAIQVTLVESPNIPTIGVGEGTWPTMRDTLLKLGISETEFIRECEASFKQGAKFCRWVTGQSDDFYYHPLVLPQGFNQCDLVPHWQQSQSGQSFSESVCYQESICEHGLAPKTLQTPEYAAVANYAYHLDAGKFTKLLTHHCTEKLGVKHIQADVVDIKNHANGYIQSLLTQQAGEISGDLFVDCTGFQSLLLGKHLKVPFVDRSNILFSDTALAVQVPYEQEDSPIASHTISTAQSAGWIWDIGLQTRRGVGYVYSSEHCTEAQAMQELASYVGPQFDNLKVRKIPIHCGHRQQFWHNNVVAVGLSAGFLEPLEASALVLVEMSATMIAEQMPANNEVMAVIAKRFNETFLYRWDRIVDFLKLHYLLNQRNDNAFWQDHRNPQSVPDSLQELMQLWRYHPPQDHDFTSNNEVFPAASYQYILYGMGFKSEFQHRYLSANTRQMAEQQFSINQRNIQQVLSRLPHNRDILNKIKQYGLQAI